MALLRPSEQTLRRILSRQAQDRWGQDYQPAIRANPKEAPSMSRPTRLSYSKLGREIHLLSLSERNAALLALHHPGLVDLHEQKMLSPDPRLHPAALHPLMSGALLAPLRGLIAVAEKLGLLKFLKMIRASVGGERRWVVHPYIGDLLLYLRNSDGIYCVNWNIKLTDADFRKKFSMRPQKRDKPDDTSALARHEIERAYFADGGIKTIQVAGVNIDKEVIANLRICFGFNKVQIDESLREPVLEKFQASLQAGVPPLVAIQELRLRRICEPQTSLTIMYQGIWSRALRVDLFSPILPDRPLNPEKIDVFQKYADWFGRG